MKNLSENPSILSQRARSVWELVGRGAIPIWVGHLGATRVAILFTINLTELLREEVLVTSGGLKSDDFHQSQDRFCI